MALKLLPLLERVRDECTNGFVLKKSESNSMRKNEPLSQVMSTDVITVHDGQPVSSLRTIFEENPIHHLPVVSGDEVIGIVTSTDFMRISFGEFGNQDAKGLDAVLDHTYKLHDIMVKNPITIEKSSTVREAAKALGSGNFHALPVVENNKLVGIVTSTDLLNFLAAA